MAAVNYNLLLRVRQVSETLTGKRYCVFRGVSDGLVPPNRKHYKQMYLCIRINQNRFCAAVHEVLFQDKIK